MLFRSMAHMNKASSLQFAKRSWWFSVQKEYPCDEFGERSKKLIVVQVSFARHFMVPWDCKGLVTIQTEIVFHLIMSKRELLMLRPSCLLHRPVFGPHILWYLDHHYYIMDHDVLPLMPFLHTRRVFAVVCSRKPMLTLP